MSGVGVWFVGACGNIAITSMIGARALARGETGTTGLVTERPPCTDLPLPDVDELVFGGHDIRGGDLWTFTDRLCEQNGVPTRETLDAVEPDLHEIEEHVRVGTTHNCGAAVEAMAAPAAVGDDRPIADIVERLRADYARFKADYDLDRVIVANVASTEPMLADPDRYDSAAAIEEAVERDDRDLPASTLYAYAALVDGHPYVNFTPSTGASLGGMRELADERQVPHMGNDGKTGESLMKSALGPMFAGRNLRMLSWEGHNILGNTDGEVLEDDDHKRGKLASKSGILDAMFDEPFHNRVRIDYTPSLGDWKTAWDYVHFEGFLGAKMTLQFTWEGSDSALAAPLVLDLVRLLAHADERGDGGLQPHLASFFKAPLGVGEHDFSAQLALLHGYADRHARDREDAPESETFTD